MEAYLITSLILFMEAAILVFSRNSLAMEESWPSSFRVFRDDCRSSMLSLLRCTVACENQRTHDTSHKKRNLLQLLRSAYRCVLKLRAVIEMYFIIPLDQYFLVT
jgi:hypothetical protein